MCVEGTCKLVAPILHVGLLNVLFNLAHILKAGLRSAASIEILPGINVRKSQAVYALSVPEIRNEPLKTIIHTRIINFFRNQRLRSVFFMIILLNKF